MQPETPINVNPEGAGAPSKCFLLSRTFWIAILGLLIAPALKKIGVHFTDAETQQIAEQLGGLLTLGGVVWARSKAAGPLHFGTGIAPMLIAIVSIAGLLGGCAALRSAQSKPWVQSLERSAARAAISFAANSLTGGNSDQAWAITQGLHTITDAVRALPNEQAAQLVSDTAIAFTGSDRPAVRAVAGQLAAAFGQAAPTTAADRSLAVVRLASGISSALLTIPAR